MFLAPHLGVAYDGVLSVVKRFLVCVVLFGTSIRGCVREGESMVGVAESELKKGDLIED